MSSEPQQAATLRILMVSSDWHGWKALQGLQQVPDCQLQGLITAPAAKATGIVGYTRFASLLPSVPVCEVDTINGPEAHSFIRALEPDVLLVVGWSELLAPEILAMPRRKAVGFHPTELPKHRGRAPIPWSLIHDLRHSAISFFELQPGADTGPILLQPRFSIPPDATAAFVYRTVGRLVKASMPGLIEAIRSRGPSIRQDTKRASLWMRRRPADGIIDWNQSAAALHNWVRGLSFPYPGAFTFWRDKKVMVWRAEVLCVDGHEAPPGTVVRTDSTGIVVAAGAGLLRLLIVQEEGESPVRASTCAVNRGLTAGEQFG